MSTVDATHAAYAQMQARLVELLLRRDVQRFGQYYAERSGFDSERPGSAYLQHYRELGVLFMLADELFEHILPRIVRRLSFESPRDIVVEEPPPRGRVDWNRTIAATWDERPGEPPLLLHTRRRRRDFATPENLLTVLTLLEYHADIQQLLWGEYTTLGVAALRHPLREIAERCERELAFPQFAGIRAQARRTLTQDGGIQLEMQVEERLAPGGNSAYEELLAWRRRRRALRLLERTPSVSPTDTLGANPVRDNYLYQLWIFYELVDMILRDQPDALWSPADAWITFRWGADGDTCGYRLQHDRAIPDLPVIWPNGPGVRPDFYIARVEPPPQRVSDEGRLIWREPGYVWDAKYYRPLEDADPTAPTGPIKRMIADLQLTGEQRGMLLFAFHGAETASDAADTIGPDARTAQRVAPDTRIIVRRLCPQGVDNAAALEQTLRMLLDEAHRQLRQPIEVQCHGVFLDTLTANAHGALAESMPLRTWSGEQPDPADLLVCPKPHIAPWRVDIVSLTRDCCTNSAVCHIKGRPGVAPPQRLSALDEITRAIKQGDTTADDDRLAEMATVQVVRITRRYAQLLQPNIADYRRWIRERLEVEALFDTTPLLNEAHRETLALGRFLWEQIEQIKASNFAGPVLLFTGVLEEIARNTFYRYSPPLCDTAGKPLMKSLGTLGNCKGFGGANWGILQEAIVNGGHWRADITETRTLTLSDWIDMVRAICTIRNSAAHKAHVDRNEFQQFIVRYFGSAMTGIGIMNGLLLAWRD